MVSRQKKEEWHQAVANRMRMLRKAAGLTQEQVWERTDIAPQHISRLETARQVPTLDTIIDIAEALNTTPSALLAEPQQGDQLERLARIGSVFSTLNDEDAAFLENQMMGWMFHVKGLRRD